MQANEKPHLGDDRRYRRAIADRARCGSQICLLPDDRKPKEAAASLLARFSSTVGEEHSKAAKDLMSLEKKKEKKPCNETSAYARFPVVASMALLV